jgi:DNA-binding MarR family transcriptional regulator
VTLEQTLTALAGGIDRHLPITMALAFARVAAAGERGISQADLRRALKLSSAATVRTVQTLSDTHWAGDRPGLKLIARYPDPDRSNRRVLRLTDKGRALLTKASLRCESQVEC